MLTPSLYTLPKETKCIRMKDMSYINQHRYIKAGNTTLIRFGVKVLY